MGLSPKAIYNAKSVSSKSRGRFLWLASHYISHNLDILNLKLPRVPRDKLKSKRIYLKSFFRTIGTKSGILPV